MTDHPSVLAATIAALAATAWHAAGWGIVLAIAAWALTVAYYYRQTSTLAERELERFFRASSQPLVRCAFPHNDESRVSEGRFTAANAAACEALGYTEADLTALPFSEFFAAEDHGDTARDVQAAIRSGRRLMRYVNSYVAGPLHDAPGSTIYVRWPGNPDPRSSIAAFSIVTEDIAARDRAERLAEQLAAQKVLAQAHDRTMRALSTQVMTQLEQEGADA